MAPPLTSLSRPFHAFQSHCCDLRGGWQRAPNNLLPSLGPSPNPSPTLLEDATLTLSLWNDSAVPKTFRTSSDTWLWLLWVPPAISYVFPTLAPASVHRNGAPVIPGHLCLHTFAQAVLSAWMPFSLRCVTMPHPLKNNSSVTSSSNPPRSQSDLDTSLCSHSGLPDCSPSSSLSSLRAGTPFFLLIPAAPHRAWHTVGSAGSQSQWAPSSPGALLISWATDQGGWQAGCQPPRYFLYHEGPGSATLGAEPGSLTATTGTGAWVGVLSYLTGVFQKLKQDRSRLRLGETDRYTPPRHSERARGADAPAVGQTLDPPNRWWCARV